MKYAHIVSAFLSEVWAIHPTKLEAMEAVLAFAAQGGKLSPVEIQAATGGPRSKVKPTQGKVAILPLYGVIANRAGGIENASVEFTAADQFGRALDAMLSDSTVGSIVLDVDSPGGTVGGVPELADKIYQARGVKPIIAVAQRAASAAYWIAAAAKTLVVSTSGEVGSVGVFAVHTDQSAADQAEGLKRTIVSAGQYKTEMNPWEPLSAEAQAFLQERVAATHKKFIAALATFRGASRAKVAEEFGKGRMVDAEQAVERGMADEVATLDDVIRRLTGAESKGGGRSLAAARFEAERVR